MAAPISGLDALGSLEAQLQHLFIQANQREASLTVPTGVFGTAYDFEGNTASFTATAVPVTISEVAGVVTVTAATIAGLP